ncbi:DUF1176 domain-containing protein [Brevundimonas sp.]|uniref:DUF1176 domain-containing protein n=1 Tax=Brevundimonas sp. TaxID=1871086 RepID=UPI002B8B743F|nr:DUF1176 domain-containing protein [Brevundimonas sp.]HWQ86685.1 DUF1176 domain-containing protein [Brevundimonas sp.]
MRYLGGACLAAAALTACGPADQPAAAAPAPGQAAAVQNAAPAAAARSESREFRDWRATCDNTNDCVAFGPASEGTGWVRVGSAPGPDGARTVTVGFWPSSGDGLTGPVTLTLDGRRHVAAAIAGDHDPLGAAAVRATDAAAVASAMAAGETLTLTAGGETVPMSLSGASAAMLWIDERQGRLDTPTALVRKGTRPASGVPGPAPAPEVIAAPPIAQTGFGDSGQTLPPALEAVAAVKACRAETGDSAVSKEVMSARLDASTELWAVPCFAGAYNIGHDWYLTGPGGRNPRAVSLPSATGESDPGTINGGYDPGTRTISAFSKGRGIGDCGTASTWTWTGSAFVLSAESSMGECWGVPADFWPTTWRTR